MKSENCTARPIVFSSEMVRKILSGAKTQTRRVITPQPPDSIDSLHGYAFRERAPYKLENPDTGEYFGFGFDEGSTFWRCPYSKHRKSGSYLWVRETWYYDDSTFINKKGYKQPADFDPLNLYYRADGECCDQIPECQCASEGKVKWLPSIRMPRWASRILLEITDIRVERLNEITEKDAVAEGYSHQLVPGWQYQGHQTAKESFLSSQWASSVTAIHANPWVWVIEFKVKDVRVI